MIHDDNRFPGPESIGLTSRRRFLRSLAGAGCAVAAGPLLAACRSKRATTGDPATSTRTPTRPSPDGSPTTAQSAPDPTATRDPAVATVALVATSDRASGVRRAIELLAPRAMRGRQVLLKPNYNSADPSPGSTHPDVLRALLAHLSDMGTGAIVIGERSGMGDTRSVMAELGVLDIAAGFGASVLVFDELDEDAWEMVTADGLHWRRGFPVPRALRQADSVVQTCNLKTHAHGGHFTLSLKNSVGFVAKEHGGHDYMDELHASNHQRLMIAEANIAYEPALVVMDGVEAFVRGGPSTGATAATGIVLAATDRVAIDAVGVAVLRLHGTTEQVSRGSVFEQEQIARAAELGLGVDSPTRIAFAVDDDSGEAYAERIRSVLAS